MYNFILSWEARERERFPFPITHKMESLLRSANLLKFYEEDTSLKGNSAFLLYIIYHSDHGQWEFIVGQDSWY